MIGFATWEIGKNTRKGVSMIHNTAKVHEMISKATITKKANPALVQAILSWCIKDVTTIIYREKF